MSDGNRELPKGWERTNLSKVVAYSTEKAEPDSFGDTKYIGLEHIERDSNTLTGTGDVSGVKSTKSRFRAGDVLYGKLRPYLNKVVRPDFDGICSTDILVYPQTEALDNGLLLHFLSRASTVEYATQNAKGINLPRISPKTLGEIDLPLPPLPEQRRIVAKIEALQERSRSARESLQAIKPLLETFRRSVLASAFRGDLTADWRVQHPDVEPASELLNRIRVERRQRWEEAELAKYEAKGKKPPKGWKDKRYKEAEAVDTKLTHDLPSGWCWATIDTTSFVTKLAGFEFTKFVNYDDDGDLAVIKAENAGPLGFRRTNFSRIHSSTVANLTRSQIVAGDVLMVFVGAGVAQVACVPDDQPYFLGPNIAMIRIESSYLRPKYLEHFLRSPVGFNLAMSFTKAVAQPSLSMGTIRKIPVPIPPMEEQKKIEALVEATIERVVEVEAAFAESQSQIDTLDQSILAKAFRGELVPQDPNDEPASVLLERIREQREAAEANGKKKTKRPRKKKA